MLRFFGLHWFQLSWYTFIVKLKGVEGDGPCGEFLLCGEGLLHVHEVGEGFVFFANFGLVSDFEIVLDYFLDVLKISVETFTFYW